MKQIIDLIRHGKPLGGAKYRGHGIDDPLSEKGWKQMWQGVGNEQWELIISSPLLRCADFAKQLATKQTIPVIIRDNLKEIGFGEWEGKSSAELRAERTEEFKAFYADPVQNTPPKAEKVSDFFYRIGLEYQDILQQHPNQKILIVGHSGVIRALISHSIGLPMDKMYRLYIQNGEVSRLLVEQQQGILSFLNGTNKTNIKR
jgi:probable phosphoglycerate mutase